MKYLIILAILIGSNAANAQWIQLNSGTNVSLNEIMFPTANIGYVVGNKGTVLKTSDGGSNWNSLNTGLSVNFHELYFITANEGWIVGDSGSVCHTVNEGIGWDCSFLDSAKYINLHSVFALNSNTILIGGKMNNIDGYLAKTTNGGSTWKTANMERYLWDVDIKKIAMVNDTVGYAINRGYVLKTSDGGSNWYITDTASVQAGNMFHVLEDLAFFPNNDTVYTCGWYGAYFGKTVNGGDIWQHNNDHQSYNLDFLNTQVGYIGGWGQVHKTVDGGVSFVDASGGSSALFEDIYSIDFTDEWTGYACGNKGKIFKTSNGGSTSIPQISDTKPSVLVYPNPTRGKINFSAITNVQLTNATGKILDDRKNVDSIDLSEQSAGIYFIILTDKNGQVIQRNKIVKE